MGFRKIGRRGKKTQTMVNAAMSRMERLTELSVWMNAQGRPELAGRYLDLSRRIGMRYNLNPHDRTRRCRSCGSPLFTSSQVRVRIRRGMIIRRCMACGDIYRIGTGGKDNGRSNGKKAEGQGN